MNSSSNEYAPKRYVSYGRFSDDKQNALSADDQILKCEKYIQEREGIAVGRYADCAISGRRNDREGFIRLMQDATAGKFDVVIAEALDRLSRDQADIATFYKHMQYHGIEVHTVDEGVINELHIGLKGTMNAMFSVDLAKKVKRGMEKCVFEEGKNVGNYSYGYRIEYELDGNGEPERRSDGRRKSGRLAINEDEASVVHQIFEWFSEGMGPIEIARRLNEKGIAGPKGRKWSAFTIRGNRAEGTGILNNKLYIGKRIWGKTRQIRDPVTGKSKNRWKPRSEWKEIDVPHLKIVHDNLWKSVKAKQDEINYVTHDSRKQNPLNPKRRPKYLLSGKMECGECGENFRIVGSGSCSCSNAVSGRGCKNRMRVKYAVIEEAVLKGMAEHLLTPENIKKFLNDFQIEYQHQLQAYETEQSVLKKEELKIQSKIDAILRAIERGVDTVSTRSRLLELERDMARIKRQYISIQRRDVPTKVQVEEYRKKVVNLAESLSKKEIKHPVMDALRPLISRIVITPTEGGWLGTLRGDLAALIEQNSHQEMTIMLPQ